MSRIPIISIMTRSPDLMLRNCVVIYFSPKPANFGNDGTMLLPSAPWQPVHIMTLVLPTATSPAAKTLLTNSIENRHIMDKIFLFMVILALTIR